MVFRGHRLKHSWVDVHRYLPKVWKQHHFRRLKQKIVAGGVRWLKKTTVSAVVTGRRLPVAVVLNTHFVAAAAAVVVVAAPAPVAEHCCADRKDCQNVATEVGSWGSA